MVNTVEMGDTLRASHPFGRVLSDFYTPATTGGLLPAEARLLDAVRRGYVCRIESVPPAAPDENNRVRGSFVRFLTLGGDETAPVHESGALLEGAWIDGDVELTNTQCLRPLTLQRCHLAGSVQLQSCRAFTINLDGSTIDSINGRDSFIQGSVFMRSGFSSRGGVDLSGARITGAWDCSGGAFFVDDRSSEQIAVRADFLTVNGSAFLCDGFVAKGEVRLRGAKIGADLHCMAGTFENFRALPA